MAIQFGCQQCQFLLSIGDENAGKQARCPQCGNIQTVPSSESSASAEALLSITPSEESPSASAAVEHDPFAATRSTNPYAAPIAAIGMVGSSLDIAKTKVWGPGICLLTISAIDSLLAALGTLGGIFSFATGGAEHDDVIPFIMIVLSLLLGIITCIGAIQMTRLKNYRMALTAAVLGVAPTGCLWCLTLPFGIWAMLVLFDPQVRGEFRKAESCPSNSAA
jgi:hypothetical protein